MIPPASPVSDHNAFAFLSGGGEMGQLMRQLDWSKNELGPVNTWPQSLRTTLGIVLASRFPMILYWGPQLVCLYNDAFRPSLGQDGKHRGSLGKPAREFFPEAWPGLEPLFAQVLAGGEATWSEDQLIPIYRNGQMEDVYWTYSFSPVRDESGSVGGVLAACQETTRQVNMIQELRWANERFGNLVQQATIGIIVLSGEQMRVELVNQMYGRLIDRSPEELQGKDLFTIIPEAEEGFRPILDKVRLTGQPLYLYDHPYFVYVQGEKKEGYLNLVYQPYKETDGRITGVLVLCHEVTQQVVAQKKLAESQERFHILADHIPNLAWMASQDGSIFWYNSRWYEYTGTTPEQMKGWGWQSVHDPQVLPQVMQQWTLSLSLGEPFEMVFPLKSAQGVYRPFLTRAIPLYDSGGQLTRWFGTNTNISEQQTARQQLQALNEELATASEEVAAANEELRAANEEIQASNEDLSQSNGQLLRTNVDLDNFIYTASHDLKAPIANIEGLLLVLLRQLSPETMQQERVRGITQMMAHSVERFKKTIANLTDIARLQKENGEAPSLVDLSAVVREIMLDLAPLTQEAKAQVEVDLAGCPAISFSEKNLRSILYNLLSNAIKYRSPDREPRVQLSCRPVPGYLLLSVADNGLGIDLAREQKVFAMFGRLHTHVEGSGVGLYMVKKIIENEGGKIEVESQVGVGSIFKVYFKR